MTGDTALYLQWKVWMTVQVELFDTAKLDFSRWYTISNTAFNLTKASVKFEFATSNCLGGDAFTRKYIISTLTLGQGHTQNVAQYPLHHMTYAPAKFELLCPTV